MKQLIVAVLNFVEKPKKKEAEVRPLVGVTSINLTTKLMGGRWKGAGILHVAYISFICRIVQYDGGLCKFIRMIHDPASTTLLQLAFSDYTFY